MNYFKSFYVLPCLELDGDTMSYQNHQDFYSQMSELQERKHNNPDFQFKSFWTVYGINQDNLSEAISDLVSEQSANHMIDKLMSHGVNVSSTPETTEAFWDCNCCLNYIHPKSSGACNQCGADYDSYPHDYPDSRLEELKEPCNIAHVQQMKPTKESL